jgi:hypothetical protein
MNTFRAARVARNNAAWCNLVSIAHGGATHFSAAAWWNQRKGPPHYPNVVTLDPDAGPTAVLPIIGELLGSPSLAAFGVKNSFCTLDPANSGFFQRFHASWIWKAPARPRANTLPVRWTVLQEPSELAKMGGDLVAERNSWGHHSKTKTVSCSTASRLGRRLRRRLR